jgi:hypothetical protein
VGGMVVGHERETGRRVIASCVIRERWRVVG